MKLPRAFCASLASLMLVLLPERARADINFNVFYNELAPYGDWVQTADYGYVWQPVGVGVGWQPYTVGQWVYTDDGWAWVSQESWGWATYHYGRWTNLRGRGWCWVPGYEWAPAWVSWRSGGGYVGWAPLPPEVVWQPSVGISVGIGISFGVGPSFYRFCPDRYFGYGNVGNFCVPPQNNVTIIQNTTNITNITNVVNNNQNVIYNGGPDYQELSRAGNVRRARIDRVETVNPRTGRGPNSSRNVLDGDRLRVVAPRVTKDPDARPPRVAAKVGPRQSDRGWTDLTPAQRQNVRNQMVAETRKPRPAAAGATARRDLPGNRPTAPTAVRPKPLPAADRASRPASVPAPRPLPGQASRPNRDTVAARPRPLPDRAEARPGTNVNRVPRPATAAPAQVTRPRPLPTSQVPAAPRPRPAQAAPRQDSEAARRSMERVIVRPPASARPEQVRPRPPQAAPARPAPVQAQRPAPPRNNSAPAKARPAKKDKSDD